MEAEEAVRGCGAAAGGAAAASAACRAPVPRVFFLDSAGGGRSGAGAEGGVRQESPHVEGREAAKRAERAQGLPSCMLHPHRRLHLSFRGRFVETCAVWMVRVGAWMSK